MKPWIKALFQTHKHDSGKETIMTSKASSYLRGLGLLLLAGICIACAVPSADAQSSAGVQNGGDHGAKIMGHLSLDLSNFRDAVLREKDGNRYLYIQNAGSNQVTIVNVSRRKKPKLAGTMTLSGDSSVSHVDFQGDVAIVASGNQSPPVTEKPSPSEVSIWDYSKPGSPQLVKKFTGVKKIISGSADIVYVLDSEGLTIVQVYDQQRRDWDYDTSHIGP
jgi:hypothetical protein